LLGYRTATEKLRVLVADHEARVIKKGGPEAQEVLEQLSLLSSLGDASYIRFRAFALNFVRGRHYFIRKCCFGDDCDPLFDESEVLAFGE
jgi:hypothetical protein